MLEDNHFVFTQQLLFAVDINKKIRIVGVQIMHGDMLKLLCLL